jgi:hypothetical protein
VPFFVQSICAPGESRGSQIFNFPRNLFARKTDDISGDLKILANCP